MARNLLYTTTFLAPLITSATSEVLPFDIQQILRDTRPSWPHRSSGTTQQDIVFDNTASVPMNGLLVNRTNYPAIKLFRSADNSTYTPWTPNLLLVSHQPDTSPWQVSGVITPTLSTNGPDRLGPAPQSLLMGTGAILFQQVNLGVTANRQWVGEMWLRVPAGSVTLTLRLSATGASNIDQSILVTRKWQRYAVSGTISGASGNTAELRLVNPNAGTITVLMGGAQLTCDTVTPRLCLYETDANGLVIRSSIRTGRRHSFLDLVNVSNRYTKYTIPNGQTTGDGIAGYTTGGLSFTGTMSQLPGGHVFPQPVDIPNPEARGRYESLGSEVLSLGEPQVILGIEGDFDSGLQEDFVMQLTRLQRGKKILLFENLHVGGSAAGAIDPTKAYLCRLLSQTRARYPMPEVFSTSLSFEEIV